MKHLSSRLTSLSRISIGCSLFGAAALAVDFESNGTGGGDWAVGGTWAGGTVPSNTNNAAGTGHDAIVMVGDTVTITGAQTSRRVLVGEDGVPGSTVGTLTMTGGTLTADAIYIGTDRDASGAGATAGNGVFNFIDGTITLNENINNGDPFSQALEIGTQNGSEGLMVMGDGANNPMLSIAGGRVEVGGEGDTGAGNTTGTFDFRSGTITGGNQNLIIGQSNTGGSATMTVGDTIAAGYTGTATYNGINSLNFNNGAGDLTIGNGGSMTANILFWQANNNAASTSNLTIQTGGTLTVTGKVDNRNGANLLTMDGGTFVFANTGDQGTDAREVENLIVTANGGTFEFAVDDGTVNGIRAFDVGNDLGNNPTDGDALSATIDGTLTIDMQVDTSADNSGTVDTWIAGSAAWDTVTPAGAQWDLGVAPEDVGAVGAGTTYEVLTYDYDFVAGAPRGGLAAGTQGNADGEFQGAGQVVSADAVNWSLTAIDADGDQVGGPNGALGTEGFIATALNTLQVSPSQALFNSGADDVTTGAGQDLTIGTFVGADAAGLTITDVNSLTVQNDLILGGATQGTINQGSVGGAATGGMAVTVNGDLIFGNGGAQGGVYNLNEGTLSVTGQIVEGQVGTPDAAVNNAQIQINGGVNALSAAGGVTVQRFSVGQVDGSVASQEISVAAGLPSVTTTGTFAVGTGTNGSKDGDPGVVAGAIGTVVVDGGTVNALNVNIAENGDSQGSLTLRNNSTFTSSGRIYVAGGQNTDQDNETVGSIAVESGSTLTVNSGNLEIGRDGQGSFTVDAGTYNQVAGNLVLGQNGGVADSSGAVTWRNGADINIGNGVDPFTSALNINGGGGTVLQQGATTNVSIEQNLNLSSSGNASSYTLEDGILFVGQDISARGGNGQDTFSNVAGEITVTRNVNMTQGTLNTLTITGSDGTFNIGNDLILDGSATVEFVLDAAGVAPIVAAEELNLGDGLGNDASITLDFTLWEAALNTPLAFGDIDLIVAMDTTVDAGAGDPALALATEVWGNVAYGDVVYTSGIDGSQYLLEERLGSLTVYLHAVVPEPSSSMLLALGFGSLLLRRRRS